MNQRTIELPSGKTVPLLNLRGKDYLEVKHRLVWFREVHPTWSIQTELVEKSDKHAVAKATIVDDTGRVRATAHKHENQQGFQDFREKSETGAIGRALAFVGFGTQFAPDLEEGERIVDAPVERSTPFEKPRAVPTDNQQHSQNGPGDSSGSFVVRFGKKWNGYTLTDMGPENVRSYAVWLSGEAKKKGEEPTGAAREFLDKARVFLQHGG